jgi:tripartite-type tricarboxylate transporter receptor subunit TctC
MTGVHVKTALLPIFAIGWMLSALSTAAAFPDRVVRIVVPFSPGGVTDLAARFIGERLSTKWGKSVIIENRTGGAGIIGVTTVTGAEPDGHTLLMATNGEFVVKPAISTAKLPYDWERDLAPISFVASAPYAWAAHSSSGIGSLKDLVAVAKSKPGHLAYSSAGYGSTMHMASEQFALATGIKLLHVPYKGGSPAATAVIAGEVPLGLISTNSVAPLLDARSAKLLAVTGRTRSKTIPDVPTVVETGVLPDFEAIVWAGLFAPKATPAEIVAKIEAAVRESLKDPALIEKMESIGLIPGEASGTQMAKQIKEEFAGMTKVAAESGVRLD